jgi:polysaccharide export outer membrane protein
MVGARWVALALALGAAAGLAGVSASAEDNPPAAKSKPATSPKAVKAAPSAEANGPATNSAATRAEEHKLSVGDHLSFRIVEEPKSLTVTDSGELEVPYIGRVPAENKTCKQLAAEIKAALEKDYYQHATVLLAIDAMSKTQGRVYLVGEVQRPGPVELPSDEPFTLSKAILRAGGFGDYADRKHVKVTRKGAQKSDRKTFTVNVGEIFDHGKLDLDVPLEAGDQIYVPAHLMRF